MRRNRLPEWAAPVLLATCLAAGCQDSAPPTELIDFPNLTCGDTRLNADAEAYLISDPQGGRQPALSVQVCLDCDGTVIAAAGGMTGRIEAPPAGTPTILTSLFGLSRTGADGCTRMVFPNVPEQLAGQSIAIGVSDKGGRVVKELKVTVGDRR